MGTEQCAVVVFLKLKSILRTKLIKLVFFFSWNFLK